MVEGNMSLWLPFMSFKYDLLTAVYSSVPSKKPSILFFFIFFYLVYA